MKNYFTHLCGRATRIALFVCALMIGGGVSAWAQKTLPYEYGFEKNFATEGWTMVDCYNESYTATYSGTGLYSLSSGGFEGNYAFRFFGYSGYNVQSLISPELTPSTTGIDVTFHYKSTTTSIAQNFCIGYSTTDASAFTWVKDISYKSTEWYEDHIIFPSGTKYFAIKYTSSTQYTNLCFDGFVVSSINPYKTPTAFSMDSYTENSATFSWTAGNNELDCSYDLKYSTAEDFDPDTEGTLIQNIASPYTLSGLTTGIPHYAYLRANYGSGHCSEWTEKLEFTPRTEIITDVNQSTDLRSANAPPINGNSVNNSLTRWQFIIPSSSLTEVDGRQITQLTFYAYDTYSSVDFESAEFEVYMRKVSESTYSSTTMGDWGTKVRNSGTVSVSDQKLIIVLNTPYNYEGGHLQIGLKQTVKSKISHYTPWYYVSSSNSSRYSIDDGAATIYDYSPKMTITSVPITTAPVQIDDNGYTTFASPRALDLTKANLPSGLNAYKAETVDGTTVHFTPINSAVDANTGILLEGTANATYRIPVVASGSDISGSNKFLVNIDGGTFSPDASYTYFGLLKNSSPLTFGTFAPGSVAIPSNKAYLKVLTSSLPATSRLTCVFDNDTEGIQGVKADALASDVYYNLAGQRVNAPTKGLYIVNGKKVIIK